MIILNLKNLQLKLLGMYWEKLPKEPFSNEEFSFENTFLALFSKSENAEFALICLKAYQYFIIYIKDKFTIMKIV